MMVSKDDELTKWIEMLDKRDSKAYRAINKLAKIGDTVAVEALIHFVEVMRNYEAELRDIPIIGGKKDRKTLEEKYGVHPSIVSGEVKPGLLIRSAEAALVSLGNVDGLKVVLAGDHPHIIKDALVKILQFDPCWKIKIHSRSERNPEAVDLIYGIPSEPNVTIEDLKIQMIQKGNGDKIPETELIAKIPEELLDSIIYLLNGGEGKIYRSISAIAALILSSVRDNAVVIHALREMLNATFRNTWKRNSVYAPKCWVTFLSSEEASQSPLDRPLGEMLDDSAEPSQDQLLDECVALALVRLNDKDSTKMIVQKASRRDWSDLIFHAYQYLFKDNLDEFIKEIVCSAQDGRMVPNGFGGECDSRIRAMIRLEAIGGSDVTQPLMSYVGSDDLDIRVLAIRKLGNLGDPSALVLLNEQLNDGNRRIRRVAKRAIKRIEER